MDVRVDTYRHGGGQPQVTPEALLDFFGMTPVKTHAGPPKSTLAAILAVVALGAFCLLTTSTAASAQPSITVLEAALQPGAQWPVASPVTLTVKFSGNVSLATWQWIGQDGKPPVWNGEPLSQKDLRPTEGIWVGMMPAPPVPGTYSARLTARAPGSAWDFPRRPPQFERTVRTWLQSRVLAPKKAA